MAKKTMIFQYTDKLENPLIDIKRNGMVGWKIGNLTILSKKKMSNSFTLWGEGVSYKTGDQVMYITIYYTCRHSHISQSNLTPNITPKLWLTSESIICERKNLKNILVKERNLKKFVFGSKKTH
jgi:hypothetical protein